MPSYIRTRTEFAVNSFTSENQTAPSVATFADGGFVVTWVTTDPTQDGDDNAIKAQLFDSAGRKVGAEFLVNSAANGAQFTPKVETLDNGNFLVTWVTNVSDDGSDGIKAQLFSRNGDRIGAEFKVNATESSGGVFEANVTSLADGRFIISWDDWGSVKAQIFDSAGTRIGGILTLNTTWAEGYGDVIALANGGFVATWRTTTSNSWDVKAQIFNASGGKVGGEFLVNTTVAGSQNSPAATALADGGFVITWSESNPEYQSGNTRIKAQVYSASGAKVGGELLVSTTTAYTMGGQVVTALPDGGFIIAWHNTNLLSGGGSDSEVKAQRFDAAGAKVDGEFQINSLTTGSQWLPDLDTLADGRVVAVWASGSGDISGSSVRAQILGTEPAEPLANTRPIIISNGGGTSASLTIDEGVTAVTRVVASDDGEPNNLRYSISGGYNADLFTINALTGALSFINATDHVEGGDNFYTVTVTASDGELSGFQSIQISVRHVNHVTIVSDGGYDYAQISVDENQTAVTTVSAVDDDGLPLTYTITGGEDAAFFTIDAETGALTFTAAPDYEHPANMYGDNVYFVQVTASDGSRSDVQDIAVQVNDVDEPEGFAITSDGGGDHAELLVPENSLAVTVVTVTGAVGPVTYEIVGGANASWFEIDPETGALSFGGPPDFETGIYGAYGPWYYDPYNNPDRYSVIVRASDGVSYDEQEFIITIDDVDEAPIFESYYGAGHVETTVSENDADLGYVSASDPDRYGWVSYGLDGPDAAFFQIDSYSGAFSFIQPPDFEAWSDADGDNVYEVSVVAYSGMLSATQSFSFTLADLVEPVVITSDGGADSAVVTVPENSTAVTIVAADGDNVTYEIVGGADASAFTIDPSTGALAFAEAPNFEWAADADHDNVFEVVVRAGDGSTFDDQQISVNLANVDENPDFFDHEPGVIEIWAAENRAYVGILQAYDIDGGPAITYSITGGVDGALFAIDPASGDLSFLNANGPDFEAPGDADGDNAYEIEVTATAGAWSRARAFTVTVVDDNEPIVITSNGGGTSAALALNEGEKYVTTVVGDDPDGVAPTYSIVGGPEAGRFTIDATTGVLSFVDTPDFEAPADSAGANFYTVQVAASDGLHSAWQTVQVLIGNVNEGLDITSYGGADISILIVPENQQSEARVEAADRDGDRLTYSITGGADAALFAIDPATGAVSFIVLPDYEAPTDEDGDNDYIVEVTVSDGEYSDTQILCFGITDANEPLAITSNGGGSSASVTVSENGRGVTIVAAADPDGGTPIYSIAGGADASRFTIDAQTGVLQFITAPDREAPGDAGGNNVYDVVVRATDGTFFDDQALAVTVGNVDEDLAIVSFGAADTVSLERPENGAAVGQVEAVDQDGDPVTYAIFGGADAALFRIDPATGVLSFVAAPDREAPTDADGDNVYKVEVAASSGAFTDIQGFAVTVTNVDEALAITSNGGGSTAAITVGENERNVTTVAAVDPDGSPATYSIVGGADAARFTIDPQTGLLQFVTPPDYEVAGDANGDNVYSVVVQATDGWHGDLQTLSVSVVNARDGATIIGTTGGDSISGTSTNPALRTTNSEDTVSGRDGHDTILGLGGDDWLNGDGGNDVLNGGAGADRLTGGPGKDEFVYNLAGESTAAARDVITDFSRSQNDKISLSGIDANSLVSGNQAFAFIGAAAFSGVAGQLRFEQVGGNTFVSGDLNGDRVADFQIELTGTITPVASDFAL